MSGISFQWNDGLFGMALAPTGDGYSIMYYHPLSSGMEFSVSTRLLRDTQRASAAGTFKKIHHVLVKETYKPLIIRLPKKSLLYFMIFRIYIKNFGNCPSCLYITYKNIVKTSNNPLEFN